MSCDRKIIGFLTISFCIAFLLTFPGFFFSVDELSYFSRAVAFSEFKLDLLQITISGASFSWAPAAYPLGTSFLLSFFCFFSKNAIFLSGLVYVVASIMLIRATLEKVEKVNFLPFFIFFIFPPTIYFSRGLMSEMPSLLVVSLFTYLFVTKEKTFFIYFILGLIAGFSIWFRETNLVICGGLAVLCLFRNPQLIIPFVIGLNIGMLPRIVSAELVYEQITHVKNYAPFSLKYFFRNVPLYLIITTILLPGGLVILWKYGSKYANSLKLSLGLFLAVHLVYGYNSGDHSGFFVSLFYNGRYFIPTLPLWMIAYASFAKSNNIFKKSSIKIALTIVCLLFIVSFDGLLFYLEREHKKVAVDIFEKYNDRVILYDNSAYRYLNPLHGKITRLEDYRRFEESNVGLEEEAVLVLSHKSATKRQLNFWKGQMDGIGKINSKIEVNQVDNYRVFDGTEITVFSFTPK